MLPIFHDKRRLDDKEELIECLILPQPLVEKL